MCEVRLINGSKAENYVYLGQGGDVALCLPGELLNYKGEPYIVHRREWVYDPERSPFTFCHLYVVKHH